MIPQKSCVGACVCVSVDVAGIGVCVGVDIRGCVTTVFAASIVGVDNDNDEDGGVGGGGGSGSGVKAVRSKGVDFSVYQPYARYTSGVKAVIVVANPNTLTSSTLSLDVGPDTLNTFGFANSTGPASCFSVTDLYQGGAPRIVSRASLSVLVVTVAPDHSERGGLAVLLLTPTQCL
eukprot:m.194775 g.194775  ORF g.194775 m.194775 type:complete len:176 (+) comp32541_c2_seq10:748-1275(+)